MKKIKFLLGLALAGLILGACSQTGTYENADLMNEQAASRSFNMTPYGSGGENLAVGPCGITFPVAPLTLLDTTIASGTGAPGSTSRIIITAINDGTKTTFTASGKGAKKYVIPGIENMTTNDGTNISSNGIIEVNHSPGWKSGDKISISFYYKDGSVEFLTGILHYTLVGICQETTTTLTGAPDGDVCIGTPVTLTATVTGGTLTGGTLTGGTLKIMEGMTERASLDVTGAGPYTVTYNVTTSAVSSSSFTAEYSGDGDFKPSESDPATTVSVVDCSTSTSLEASTPDDECQGTSVTLTATVTGGMGGEVQFAANGTDFGVPVPLNMDGTAITTVLVTDEDVIYTASFTADGIYADSDDEVTVLAGNDCSDDDDDEFENKFDVVTMCTNGGKDRTATFTFTAGADGNYEIQGGLTAWSSVPVLTKSTGTVTSRRVGNQNHIITWSGTLAAGETVTVTVHWTNSRNINPIIDEWNVSSVEGSVKTKLLTPSEKLGCNAMWSSHPVEN